MKFKLDENFGKRGAEVLRAADHDVMTVAEQGMCSAHDDDLIQACSSEQRVLVTMDVDFGNPLRFRPTDYSGIALIRLPPRSSPDDLCAALMTLIAELSEHAIGVSTNVLTAGRTTVEPGW